MAEPKEQEEFIDCTGRRRLFAFHTYRNGPILAIRATEVGKEFGYEFLVAGAPDSHQSAGTELRPVTPPPGRWGSRYPHSPNDRGPDRNSGTGSPQSQPAVLPVPPGLPDQCGAVPRTQA